MENEITTQGTAIVQEPTIMVEEKPMFAKPTITAENEGEKLALLGKVFNLHKEMRKFDWTPDSYNEKWEYEYFSAGMIKSNFQKACLEVGLLYMMDIDEIKSLPPVGNFRVRLNMIAYLDLIDIDTGATFSYPIMGESADTGDKCSAKLMTSTVKSVIATNFAVADIDPDMSELDIFAKREVLQDNARDSLRASGQNRPATTKAESKAKTPTKAQKPVEGKETAKDRAKPQDAPVEMVDDRSKPMTSAQKNAMSLIYNSVTEKAPEDFDLAIFENSFKTAESGGTRGHAEDWINQYKGMMK